MATFLLNASPSDTQALNVAATHLNTSPNTFLCGTPAALMRATPATMAV